MKIKWRILCRFVPVHLSDIALPCGLWYTCCSDSFGGDPPMRRTHPANMFVCECITQSLFRLMKRKPYNKITVTDLVQEAGVSRNSFYRNYQSTEEIIRQFWEEKTSKWWSEFIAYPDRYPHVISEMFYHFLDMKEEIDLLYRAGLSHLLMEHIVLCGRQSLTGELKGQLQRHQLMKQNVTEDDSYEICY